MTTQTKHLLQAASFTGLALTTIPAFLVFGGMLSKDIYLHLLNLGMLIWFCTAIFWIKKDDLN